MLVHGLTKALVVGICSEARGLESPKHSCLTTSIIPDSVENGLGYLLGKLFPDLEALSDECLTSWGSRELFREDRGDLFPAFTTHLTQGSPNDRLDSFLCTMRKRKPKQGDGRVEKGVGLLVCGRGGEEARDHLTHRATDY